MPIEFDSEYCKHHSRGLPRVVAAVNCIHAVDPDATDVQFRLEGLAVLILDQPEVRFSAPDAVLEAAEDALVILESHDAMLGRSRNDYRLRWVPRRPSDLAPVKPEDIPGASHIYIAAVANYGVVEGRSPRVAAFGLPLRIDIDVHPSSPTEPEVRVVGLRKSSGTEASRSLEAVAKHVVAAAQSSAVRHLRRLGLEDEARKVSSFRHLHRFELRLSDVSIRPERESAGLGLAVAFACAMITHAGTRKLTPTGDVLWTGVVDSEGNVGPVENSSFQCKVKSAIAGGFRGIVYPRSMPIERTESNSSDRDFALLDIETLDEVLRSSALIIARPPAGPPKSLRSPRFSLLLRTLLVVMLPLAIWGMVLRHSSSSVPDVPEPGPALVKIRPDSMGIVVSSEDGTPLFVATLPDTLIGERVEATGIYRPFQERRDAWSFARTKEGKSRAGSHILFWNPEGRCDFVLTSAICDFLGSSPDVANLRFFGSEASSVKIGRGAAFLAWEGGRESSALASVYRPDLHGDTLRLTPHTQYYHPGHFNSVHLTDGTSPGIPLLWTLAIDQDPRVGKLIPHARRLFDLAVQECRVQASLYAPFASPAEIVELRGSRGWITSNELFSFAIIGYRLSNERIDTKHDSGFELAYVHRSEGEDAATFDLRLKNGDGASVSMAPGYRIEVKLDDSDALASTACALSPDAWDRRTGQFLADALAFLVTAAEPEKLVHNARPIKRP